MTSRDGGGDARRRRERRSWGPFSGGQLTIIVVAFAVVLIPTAAMAAVGTFSSSTTTAAVTGKSTSTATGAKGVYGNQTGGGANTRWGVIGAATGPGGIGVQGSGTKYGVFSSGPLGVAAGKMLSCTACVTNADLASGGNITPLPSGQSESGMFAAVSELTNRLGAAITYARPLATPIADANIIDTNGAAGATHCPAPGSADPGYLCLYNYQATNVNPLSEDSSSAAGALLHWILKGGNGQVGGEYTVTAP